MSFPSNKTTNTDDSSPLSWREWFGQFQDDQRIERLQTHCQSLENLYRDCLKSQKSDSEAIEQRGLPLRTIKYFDWRGIAKDHPQVEKTCAREEHLVWSCRAVAVGCGKELGELKKCFEDQGPSNILSAPATAYEYDSTKKLKKNETIPCRRVQQALGNCVTDGAHALYNRRRRSRRFTSDVTTASSSKEGGK